MRRLVRAERANREEHVRAGLLGLLPIVAVFALLAFPVRASAAGTFSVTTTSDSGPGSLRQAIIDANNAAGGTIQFALPGTAPTIPLSSPLPPITAPVVLDGASQPNTPPNTPGVTIALDPNSIVSGWSLLDLGSGSDGSTVHGLAFGGLTGDGGTTAISVESDNNAITGNWIGVAADLSSVGLGNYGIEVTGNGNTIGGGAAGDPNVITGSGQQAISIDSPDGVTSPTGNVIQGNLVGLEPDGTPAPGQGNGISVTDATGTVIGNNDGPDALADVQAHPELGNVITRMGDAIRILGSSSGTIVAGNFIGVDRGGAPIGLNGDGVLVNVASGNQIGPGNTIAHSTNNGVWIVGGGTGNRIVANSIFDSGNLGIDLQSSNDDIAAPVITSVSGDTVSGTFTSLNFDPVFIELFVNPTCDAPFASGAGQTFVTFQSASPGFWSATVPALVDGQGVTATATDTSTSDTSEFSNCFTAGTVAGSLSGSVDQSVVKPVDLTATGTSDWALWGYNSADTDQPPSALTPNETKASGGRQISDLSIVNGDGTATRGFGSFADNLVPFNFNWTDGAPDAAVSGGHGGLTAPAVGQGLSFTVPADTAPRKLTIWTSAHYADGTLTAHLSDGSAPDFTQTIHAVAGQALSSGENVPAIFTLEYAAAADGQNLTVTWTQSANNNCGGCEDIVLYGAALSAGLSNLTVSAAPSSAGAGIDQVKLANIPNAWLSFFAGSTNSAPVGSTPVGSTPVGSTPVGSTPVGSTPVGSTPVGSTPVGSTPVGSTPVGSTGLFDLPVGSTPVGSTALSSVLLSQVQLHGASWDQVLCGSLLEKPLNALTLQDLKTNAEQCSDGKTSLQHFEALTMQQVDLTTTLLRTVHWATLLMGNTPLSALPGGFSAWCGTNGDIPENGGDCTNAGPTTTVLQMDVAGQLGSAPVGSTPVGSTPVGSTPVGSTPVGSTDVSASLLANIPLADISPLSPVVNCNGTFSCPGKTLGDAYRAGAILPTAKFSDIAAAMAANGITINDLVVAIIGAAGFPWEQLPIQGLQPYSATLSKVTYTVNNNVDCSIAPEFTITVHLPGHPGFFPVDGSSQFSVGNNPPQPAGTPHVVGSSAAVAAKNNTYQWTIDCPAGDSGLEAATLKFDVWVGLELGTFTTHVTASTAIGSIGTTGAPVTVHQNPEASDPSTATEIQPDRLVAGHIGFSGEQSFYKVKLDGLRRGTRIAAFLNVPSDADLDLTLSAPAAPSFFSTPVGSTPVGSTPIEDTGVGFAASGLALPPDTLQDVPVGSTPVGSTPVGSTPVGSTSANRGGGVNEAGAIITNGQGGYATIGVSGYNGATSNEPFVLRVQETPPPSLPNCPARTFANGAPSSFAAGTLPGSLPASTKTVFIVDRQRLMAIYPSTDVNNMLTALGALAARSEVGGTILYVDGNAAVRSAYAAWDTTPCDTTARNNVVRAINDVVASYRNSATGLPNLHYIVLVGSDEATPMANTFDPVLLSPEENEAADLAFTTNGLTRGNALYASAAQNDILTDGAYGTFTSIPWLDRNLLLPQISVSRLVETPGDILGQINRYVGNNGISAPQSAAGTLAPTSALVTGYDFLADGAKAVHDNLQTNFSALSTLDSFPSSGNLAINFPGLPSPWSANDVLTNALQSNNPPSIVSLDAHYNQYELESAAGDLANSGQANAALAARILFTMGCHGGLNVSDAFGTATSPNKYLDWPELYAQQQAAMYIANTGYGYGDTASVALSERLLALFAKNLHSDSGSVGEEWVNALQQYFATAGAYDVYDEKVMEETTFYGLPFWHFSTAGSSPSFTPLTTSPDPITGTQSATVTFPTGATTGTQFGLYRPNLPITSQQVTSSLPARGVWIKALASNDTNTDATIGYPTIDLTAHEPAPDVSPIFFPASPFTLEHSLAFGNERDYLNVSDQFRPTGPGAAGVQRHFVNGTFEIFYSQSPDQLAPLISQVNVSDTSGVATITARVTDDSGVAEVAALVNDGTGWQYLQLTRSTLDPTLWSGTIAVSHDPEVFVEATDGSNVSYSANKGENFTSTNSNSPPSGVQILLQAPVGPYAQNQVVDATYQCGPDAAQCIGTVPNGSPIDTSTPGLHTFVVTAFDADGNVVASLERQYSVDYPFSGFFQPVDNLPALNVAKAGSAIPVKFSLGGNQGLNIFYNSTYPTSQPINCSSSAPLDTIETTVNAGQSTLSYDATSDVYTYTWKTNAAWSGTCRALIVRTKFGTFHTADFKFK